MFGNQPLSVAVKCSPICNRFAHRCGQCGSGGTTWGAGVRARVFRPIVNVPSGRPSVQIGLQIDYRVTMCVTVGVVHIVSHTSVASSRRSRTHPAGSPFRSTQVSLIRDSCSACPPGTCINCRKLTSSPTRRCYPTPDRSAADSRTLPLRATLTLPRKSKLLPRDLRDVSSLPVAARLLKTYGSVKCRCGCKSHDGGTCVAVCAVLAARCYVLCTRFMIHPLRCTVCVQQ
jgi:hypothetical protein